MHFFEIWIAPPPNEVPNLLSSQASIANETLDKQNGPLWLSEFEEKKKLFIISTLLKFQAQKHARIFDL